jgi:hypothetical protein
VLHILIATVQPLSDTAPVGSSWGSLLTGGGLIAAALAVLKLSMNVGKMTQALDDHDKRIGRLERTRDNQSSNGSNGSGVYPRGRYRNETTDDDYRRDYEQ